MGNIGHGIVAGFVATVVLSVLMLIKAGLGMLPEMNAIRMLAQMGNQYVGLPAAPALGWLAHFLIGAILWGVLFAALVRHLPGALWLRGVLFSIGAWLLMLIIVMPMAGAGFFGLGIGVGAPVATLVLHLVFGAVLGATYAWMQGREPLGRTATRHH